eukprot:gene12060-14748_t
MELPQQHNWIKKHFSIPPYCYSCNTLIWDVGKLAYFKHDWVKEQFEGSPMCSGCSNIIFSPNLKSSGYSCTKCSLKTHKNCRNLSPKCESNHISKSLLSSIIKPSSFFELNNISSIPTLPYSTPPILSPTAESRANNIGGATGLSISGNLSASTDFSTSFESSPSPSTSRSSKSSIWTASTPGTGGSNTIGASGSVILTASGGFDRPLAKSFNVIIKTFKFSSSK